MHRITTLLTLLAFSSAAWAFPFTYQGSLEDGGAPADGSYAMTFQLTDSAVAGTLLQSIVIHAVPVNGGVFTAELDFDDVHFSGADRYLAIVVEGTSLSPRQKITYSPYAFYSDRAREAGTVRVPLVLNGTTVVIEGYASGDSGVGVRGVHLSGLGTNPGLLGQTNSKSINAAGVVGEVAITSGGAFSSGVRGINNSTGVTGIGVYGSHEGQGWGVYGVSPSGRGVFGTSETGVGVHGVNSGVGTAASLGTDKFAVHGENVKVEGEGTAIEGSGGRVGVSGVALGAGFGGDLTRIGVQGTAGDFVSGAMYIYGVKGFGQAPTDGGGRFAHGVYGSAQSGGSGSTGYGVYGAAVGPGTNYAGYFEGNVHVQGTLSKTAGAFKIDHPLEPETRYLSHSFVESPDMLNIYSGLVVLDDEGRAIVELPEYFEALNTSFRYQLTAIGGAMRDLHVATEISDNLFEIAGGMPSGKVSWEITGVRQDAAAIRNPIIVEEDKDPADFGKYLNPEAFGAGPEKAIHTGHSR